MAHGDFESRAPDSVMALGKRERVTSGSAVVEYYSRGLGPVVLLLPALATPASQFNSLVEALNDSGFRTLAVELPGMGASSRGPGDQGSLLDYADDLVAVLESAGVERGQPVHLIGRALGNRVARAFASRHPERTASVVLLAAGGKDRGRPRLGIIARYLLLQIPGLTLGIRRRILESLLCRKRNVLPAEACVRPPLEAVRTQARAAKHTDWRAWWSGGKAQMLVIQGKCDRIAPPQRAIDLQEEYPERVQVRLVEEAGHALLYDSPETVISLIVGFLESRKMDAGKGDR